MEGQQYYQGFARSFLVVLIAIALSACSASRQQPASDNAIANAAPTPVAPQPRSTTRHVHTAVQPERVSKSSTAAILARIHQSDLKEIALAKAAEDKASTDEVRSFADRLVKDYTTTDSRVVAIARKKNIHLSDSSYHRGAQANSAARTGFDRQFLRQTSVDHDKQIKALQQEREDVSDDDVETLIDQTLPILEQHQQLARLLMNKEQA